MRGHLTLKETGDTMRLNQRKGGQAIAAPEQAAMTQLFKSGPDLELEQSNHAPLGKAKDALKAGLAAAYFGKLFNANAWWAGGGLALWFLASLIVVVTVFSTFGQEPGLGMLFGSAIAIPGMITGALTLRAWRRGTPGIWGKIIGALFAIGLVAAGVWVMALFARVLVEVLPATIPALLAPLIAVGFSWLKAPSVAGRKIMDQIEGFRHYLGVAEEDRLEFLNPPKKTAGIVRALSALCRRARRRECVGQALRRRAGRRERRGDRRGLELVFGQPRPQRPGQLRQPPRRRAVADHRLGLDAARNERRKQQQLGQQRRRLLGRRRRRRRRFGVVERYSAASAARAKGRSSLRHTSASAWASASTKASSCSGVGVIRSRSVPRGTVGWLIGCR